MCKQSITIYVYNRVTLELRICSECTNKFLQLKPCGTALTDISNTLFILYTVRCLHKGYTTAVSSNINVFSVTKPGIL